MRLVLCTVYSVTPALAMIERPGSSQSTGGLMPSSAQQLRTAATICCMCCATLGALSCGL